MCGFIGCLKSDTLKKYDINKLLESIKHRGPDEQGVYEDENAVFCHARLSIIDIQSGHQPYQYRNLVIVYNGEIYNYKSLRAVLESNGYTFETDCDTEVLLKAYHFYDRDILTYIDGMFAFMIYNTSDNSVVFGRDIFGIKPLYYFSDKHDFCFASELIPLVSILQENDKNLSLDTDAQKKFLEDGFINGSCLIDNVFECAPGNLVKFCSGQTEIIAKETVQSVPACSGELEKILEAEVVSELVADVDVGVLLSGGIDSSVLTALTSRNKGSLYTYSVAFEGRNGFDETQYASYVADKFHTKHTVFEFNEDTLINYIPKLVESMDIPINDPAMLPMLLLMDNVSKHHKVVISGDGGDELFAGYTPLRVIKYRWLFMLINKALSLINFKTRVNRILKLMLNTNLTFDDAIKRDFTVLSEKLLRKTDLCSMRYGVEVRVPFLSKSTLGYVNSCDVRSFVNIRFGKIPLRRIAAKLIDDNVAYKKKQGFRVPMHEWISKGRLGEMIKKDFVSSFMVSPDVINQKDALNLFEKECIDDKLIFSVFILNQWIKRFMVTE